MKYYAPAGNKVRKANISSLSVTVIRHSKEKKEEIRLSPVTKTPTPTEQSKKQRDNIKTPPKTLITQLLRTDLGIKGIISEVRMLNIKTLSLTVQNLQQRLKLTTNQAGQ